MKVSVLSFGSLRDEIGAPGPGVPVEVEIPAGGTVAEVIAVLGLSGERVFSILVDGNRADPSASLTEGTEVTLMPPFTGGKG